MKIKLTNNKDSSADWSVRSRNCNKIQPLVHNEFPSYRRNAISIAVLNDKIQMLNKRAFIPK